MEEDPTVLLDIRPDGTTYAYEDGYPDRYGVGAISFFSNVNHFSA